VRTASLTNGAAVYVQGGRIHLLDLNTKNDQTINISVAPDTSELTPRTASAMRSLEQILPSPAGDRIVFGAREKFLYLIQQTKPCSAAMRRAIVDLPDALPPPIQ
jgi:hypothetical protein